MDVATIERRKAAIIDEFGPWTAHNMELAPGIYTIDGEKFTDEIKLRRIVQVAADVSGLPFQDMRVLDLGCLEGMYATEFARQGAEAVGVEGRHANVAKADFLREVYRLDRLSFVQDDVRNVSKGKYGEFQVVLCLGLLYHLEAQAVFNHIRNIAEMCQRVAIIDTHIALSGGSSFKDGEDEYSGILYREFSEGTTSEEQEELLWTSIDNAESFWPTRPSLYNLLGRAGFTSVYECFMPYEIGKPEGRVTLVAIKGEQQQLLTTPRFNSYPLLYWPEQESIAANDTAGRPPSEADPSPQEDAVSVELQRVQLAYDALENRVIEQDQYLRRLEAALQQAERRPGILRRLLQR